MGKSDTIIHVAIAFDQNYVVPFYALATSLVKNHAINTLHIHAITTGIIDAEKLAIREHVERAGAQISFYEIDFELVSKFVLLNKWTAAAYYKLFFPLLVPETIDRILYLDTDTVVVNNLSTLYAIELENYPVAAVYDNYVKIQPLLNINTEGEYFNSGVMLIDIKRWKEQKISQRAIDYVINYPERIRFVDQCALNGVLHDNWKRIDEKYNLLYSYIPESLSRTALTNFLLDKVVIHFTLQRPWNMLCKNRLRHLYHYYLSIALFAKPKRKYVDFSWHKIPAWITIRIFEFYSDHTLLQKIWRSGKLLTR